jgi:hypothetical protein
MEEDAIFVAQSRKNPVKEMNCHRASQVNMKTITVKKDNRQIVHSGFLALHYPFKVAGLNSHSQLTRIAGQLPRLGHKIITIIGMGMEIMLEIGIMEIIQIGMATEIMPEIGTIITHKIGLQTEEMGSKLIGVEILVVGITTERIIKDGEQIRPGIINNGTTITDIQTQTTITLTQELPHNSDVELGPLLWELEPDHL